jgi:hypothetical protein
MVAFADSQWATKYTIPTAGVPADTELAVLLTEANLPAALLDSTSGSPAKSDGGDLLAYLQDPTGGVEPATRYPIDIDAFSTGAGGTTGNAVWVGLPNVSSSVATTFWLVWGDPAGTQPARDAAYGIEAVWPASHVMVQHLSEDPTGASPQGIDSTSNNNDAAALASPNDPALVSGKIDGAWQFDGNDAASVAYDASLYPSFITVMAWCKVDTPVANDGIVGAQLNPLFDESYNLYSRVASGGLYTFLVNRDGTAGGRQVAQVARGAAGTWEHVVGTYDGSFVRIYKDAGAPAQTANAGTLNSKTDPVIFGGFTTSSSNLNGCIDEVRIINAAFDANRITTEYNCQSSPGTFATNNGVQPIGAPSAVRFPFYYWYQ